MSNSQLVKVFAAVTMIDVSEGDCYVVDLLLNSKKKGSNGWNRFAIDTGTKLKDNTRLEAIKGAVFGDPKRISPPPPWDMNISMAKDDTKLGINIPPLAGIVITHTDRDHWGNSRDLVQAMAAHCTANQLNNIPPVHIYTPPMIEWAKQIKLFDENTKPQPPSAIPNVFQVQWLRTGRLSFIHTSQALDLTRSFEDLRDLAQQLDYDLLYRFNVITREKQDAIENDPRCRFAAVHEDHILDVSCLEPRQTDFDCWQVFGLRTAHDEDMRKRSDVSWVILAEVALAPRSKTIRSSVWSEYSKRVSGFWLRRYVPASDQERVRQANANKNRDLDWMNPGPYKTRKLSDALGIGAGTKLVARIKYIDDADDKDGRMVLENEEIVPQEEAAKESRKIFTIIRRRIQPALKPVYTVVGLKDDMKHPRFISDEIGNYSCSIFGSGGSVFTRDFQHVAVQYYLSDRKNMPKKGGRMKKDEGKANDENEAVDEGDELDVPPESASDQTKWELPRNWGEYANRCSVINHWIYREPQMEIEGQSAFGPEEFTMLFTGDAFELGQGENAYRAQTKINRPQESIYTVTDAIVALMGQSGQTQDLAGFNAKPDGNLLTWLYRQRRLSSYRVDVLKVPHHGSATTTNAYFYRFVTASVYLFSASSNGHGHPSPETMDTILGALLQEDGPASAPKEFKSRAFDADAKSILDRKLPRLFFFTHEVNRTEPRPKRPAKTKKTLDDDPNERDPDLFEPFTTFYRGKIRVRDVLSFLQSHEAMHPDSGKKMVVPRVNARFFYQKNKNAASRLIFGKDRHGRLRVEWEVKDWGEMRPEWQMADRDTATDPVAYPQPFKDPSSEPWHEPAA